ncbi:MAG: ATP-binding protein [Bacteroidota bacterium]
MKKHAINIKSDLQEINEVEKFIEDICDYYNINNSYFGNIIVAITEAVENAIIHGNHSDASKKINVSFDSSKKGISFTIEDEGNGFNVNSIKDPTDVESNPDKKGTGIFLMKALADEVIFSENGRKIQLIFNITSINQEVYMNRKKNVDEYLHTQKKIFEKNN